MARVGLLCVFILGLTRFVWSALGPAAQSLRGDFGAVFPSPYFAALLRPDFPVNQSWATWNGQTVWYYGPIVHFFTLPLFLAPTVKMVPPIWATVNLLAVGAAFWLSCRLAGLRARQTQFLLAGLWLLYQPLANCFAQGNIELVELVMILGALELARRAKESAAGILLGMATMTKLLPVGFLGWLGVRGHRNILIAGSLTIGAIALLTAVTLDWRASAEVQRFSERVTHIRTTTWTATSFSAFFAHRLGTIEWADGVPTLQLTPEQRTTAVLASRMVLLTLGFLYTVLFVRRRRRPATPADCALLFLLMFLLPPDNEDYYYVFALVPLSVLLAHLAHGVQRRHWMLLGLTLLGYLLISPLIPFRWIDQTGWLPGQFWYVLKVYDLPLFGAILWLMALTWLVLTERRRPPVPPLANL